jgi:phosphotriesterase family protein
VVGRTGPGRGCGEATAGAQGRRRRQHRRPDRGGLGRHIPPGQRVNEQVDINIVVATGLPFEDRVTTVAALARAGYADRMVLSHDASCYSDFYGESYKTALLPRWNYTHITDDVLPALRQHGWSRERQRSGRPRPRPSRQLAIDRPARNRDRPDRAAGLHESPRQRVEHDVGPAVHDRGEDSG